ncbi:hypothetical protein MRB53_009956 [Persea americana]|uniref:Uncharacterized protein n=1 Tax=Persea americana TaxID=3435 RepID=A0ACC2LQJ0_PERAE|nr:hypothetical protein MRB53_009956 [Persea americana]
MNNMKGIDTCDILVIVQKGCPNKLSPLLLPNPKREPIFKNLKKSLSFLSRTGPILGCVMNLISIAVAGNVVNLLWIDDNIEIQGIKLRCDESKLIFSER